MEAVIREWLSSCAAMDVERLKALWDQEYPQLIYVPEEHNDAMTDWAAISKYYDALPALVLSAEWSMDNLMVDVIGDVAYAYFTFLVKAKVKGIDHTLVGDARDTIILRKTGGRWKIIHYHESLSQEHMHEQWGFLWS